MGAGTPHPKGNHRPHFILAEEPQAMLGCAAPWPGSLGSASFKYPITMTPKTKPHTKVGGTLHIEGFCRQAHPKEPPSTFQTRSLLSHSSFLGANPMFSTHRAARDGVCLNTTAPPTRVGTDRPRDRDGDQRNRLCPSNASSCAHPNVNRTIGGHQH